MTKQSIEDSPYAIALGCYHKGGFGQRGKTIHEGTVKEWADRIEALIRSEVCAVLERVQQSIDQHTVPEGSNLLTRSYVKNTIEFEMSRYQI